MSARRVILGALAILGILGVAASGAWARPGGGDSFSGGGGHDFGGGGGGGGSGGSGDDADFAAVLELIFHLIRLVILYPKIGVPVVILVVGYIGYSAYKKRQNTDWDSSAKWSSTPLPVTPQRAIELADIRRVDPDFSQIVFEDFAFRLFATAHRARHSPEALAAVGPYLGPEGRASLLARLPGVPITSVVIGAMRTFRVDVPRDPAGKRLLVGLEFEANVTTAEHTYFSVEAWLFGRDATRTSKPPGATKTFPCPNCGAPWQGVASGTQVCASCNQAVDNGRFDWVVEQIDLASIDERGPTLTQEVPERGTNLPTYEQRDLARRWDALHQTDPEVTKPALIARLQMIYDQLNTAWADNDLAPARGLISDGLYDYFQYWIDAYRAQHLQNCLLDMRITRSLIAKVSRDRWYDSVTVRIWGEGKDYVVRTPDGTLVKGSKKHARKYSEYWTLIRSTARKGAPRATPACGNCGAALEITQSGECKYCNAHVTSGEFDWVLSKIEQDDSYRG